VEGAVIESQLSVALEILAMGREVSTAVRRAEILTTSAAERRQALEMIAGVERHLSEVSARLAELEATGTAGHAVPSAELRAWLLRARSHVDALAGVSSVNEALLHRSIEALGEISRKFLALGTHGPGQGPPGGPKRPGGG
jgi:hypothetical protein